MRIMITGGGTGGHTSPAVAVIEELQKRDARFAARWVGCHGAIEERVSKSLGIAFRSVPVSGWPRTRSIRRLWAALRLVWSVLLSWLYIRRFSPQVVFGVGGYVSLPLMWVAQRRGIPTVIHEQNRLLGVANRLLAPRATRIFLSFPETLGEYPKERAEVVGNPVRSAFSNPPTKQFARVALKLDPNIPVILITGGSQGAQSLNDAIASALKLFTAGEVQILWMAGQSGVSKAREAAQGSPLRVEVYAFIENMAQACAASDLMICRAGASSTAEIAMMRKPSILVPYPHATDNHQEHNARVLGAAGAAVIVLHSELTGERITSAVREILSDPKRLDAMSKAAGSLAKPGAAESIAEAILGLAFAPDA